MAKSKIEVDLVINDGDSVAQAEKKTTSLKQQLKEMKALMASGTLDEGAFNKLAAEAGKLQDKIGDVNQRVKNLASDSQKLDGFISVAQGIVGGFAAVQGITALVGEENEDLQKTMVKLQGAMSALAGIQAVANTLNKDSAALTALQTVRTGALTAATTVYNLVVGGSIGLMKVFRIALAASGIGLIVLALVAAAKAMGMFGDSTELTTEEIEKQNEALKKQHELIQKFDDEDLKLRTQKAEIKKAEMKLAGESADAIINEDRKVLEYQKLQLELRLKDTKVFGEEKAKIEQQLKENENAIILKDLEIKQALQDVGDKKAQEQKDKSIAANKKYLERIAANRKDDAALALKELEESLAAEQALRDAAAEGAKTSAEERQKKANEQRSIDIQNINRVRAEGLAAADQEKKDYTDLWTAKTSIAQSGFGILNNLGELALGQQFRNTAAGKVLALSQIATDTALAFISGLRIAQQSAAGTGPAAALAFPVFYSSQLVAILGAVSKAKAALSGGSGGGGGASAPSFSSAPPATSTFTPTERSRQIEFGKIEVQVEERKITNAQRNNDRIRRNAEII